MLTVLRKLKTKLLLLQSNFFSKENIYGSKDKWNRLAKEDAQFHVLTKGEGAHNKEAFRNEGRDDTKKYVIEDLFLQSILKKIPSIRILEIGCGIGRLTEFLAPLGETVVGIDISEEMIKKASDRLAQLTNVSFVAVDGERYPFSDETFNFIFSFIVFQHMPSAEIVKKNLSEVTRVLTKDGIAKIQLRGTPIAKSSLYYGPHFVTATIKKLLEDMSVEILKTEGEGNKYFWVYLAKKRV